MVEHRLPKPVVAGSIPVSRSNFSLLIQTDHHGSFHGEVDKFHTVHTVHKGMKTRSGEAWRANRARDAKNRKRLKGLPLFASSWNAKKL